MNNISGFFNRLLGRDKETPGDRAFRHERERSHMTMSLYFVSGLCTALILHLALSGTLIGLVQIIGYGLLALVVVLYLYDTFLKWHQKKYGGY